MRKIFLLLIGLSLIFSCTNKKLQEEKKQDLKKIAESETVYLELLKKGEVDYTKGRDLVDLYNNFVKKYPKDTIVPSLVYKSGALFIKYLGDPDETIKYFEKLKEKYPKYDLTPLAIYTLGFIYNDKKKDYEKAKETYEWLIEKYPNHNLIPEAKILLDNVGKSDDELWNYIQKKNKNTNKDN
jgi:tetratricopeptide (TPR) repeat protein